MLISLIGISLYILNNRPIDITEVYTYKGNTNAEGIEIEIEELENELMAMGY